MRSVVRLVSANATETKQLGRCLAGLLRPGDLLLLFGPFGAGKTTMTQGIARGLGVRDPVTSPSFTLVNEYRAADRRRRPLLFHIDLYRIERPDEALGLGLEEYLAEEVVTVVEWPEHALEVLPEARLDVRMAYLGDTGRTMELEGHGARYAELVRQFGERCAPATMADGSHQPASRSRKRPGAQRSLARREALGGLPSGGEEAGCGS